MKPVNGKILVRANHDQKDRFVVNGVEMLSALRFEKNYREKSPVICMAESSNDIVAEGDILVCHHNTFQSPSPHYLYDDLYSIPANGEIIFCKLNIHDGSLWPVYGNMLCDRMEEKESIPLPPSQKKFYIDRCIVTEPGYTQYKKGQTIYHRKHGWYEIVYNWESNLIRTCKIHEKQVCGVLIPD